MRSFLPPVVVGCVAFLVFAVNTVVCCSLLYLLVPFKILAPSRSFRRAVGRLTVALAEIWIDVNVRGLKWTRAIDWDVAGLDTLPRSGSCLVVCNHQSSVDIVVLQWLFNRRIPLLRFFLKRELVWTPFLGLAWWALDFPFMRRHSREYLEKHPEKRGADLAATRRACEKFRDLPVSMTNFLEGTRFTEEKRRAQESPYRHLLLPKAGGVAFVVEAMPDRLETLVDVTIVYPGGPVGLWDLLSGEIPRIVVRVDARPIPEEWTGGDYLEDPLFRTRMQASVRARWEEKDALIERLLAAGPPAVADGVASPPRT